MSDAAYVLPESGEALGIVQLGLEELLGGEIAIDFHATQAHAGSVQYRAGNAFNKPRNGLQHAHFFAQAG